MRIEKLFIKEFKNLKDFEINFRKQSPYTVLVGRNGTGKSNLLEAITQIFRDLDLGESPSFSYCLEYECRGHQVNIRTFHGDSSKKHEITVDKERLTYKQLSKKKEYLPSHIFGYYSGISDRFKVLFQKHLESYRDDLIHDRKGTIRRLFRAENVHSQFVLLAFYAHEKENALKFLREYFGIKKFHSALFVFNEPHWSQKRPSKQVKDSGDERFWYARGKVKELLPVLHEVSLAPLSHDLKVEVGLKRYKTKEHKYYYIKDLATLLNWTRNLDQKTFFELLESSLLSDLLKEVRIKFELESGETISFTELSEGEQQLLTVLGLSRFTNQDESLFLLDEPDTHLNPAWSLDYLSLLKKYSGGIKKSQILMTTHDPLVITNLDKNQVRLLYFANNRKVLSMPPEEDLRGMGVNALLESELFGLRSTLGATTLNKIDERNKLYAKKKRTKKEEHKLKTLSAELAEIGILTSYRDPLYEAFSKAYARRLKKSMPKALSVEELKNQDEIADNIFNEIYEEADS